MLNEVWYIIRDKIEKQKNGSNQIHANSAVALHKMHMYKSKVELAFEKLDRDIHGHITIPRLGDIAVGFYLDKEAPTHADIKMTLEEGDFHYATIVRVMPGKFVYCLQGTHPLPLINIPVTDIKVEMIPKTKKPHLSVVLAIIDDNDNDRRRIMKNDAIITLKVVTLIASKGNLHSLHKNVNVVPSLN